jgi:hypothetical protein
MHQITRSLIFVFTLTFFTNLSSAFDMDRSYSSGLWHRDYTALVKNRLSFDRHQSLMNISPHYVGEICPRYSNLKKTDRENFWTVFFMAVAYAESDFNHHSRPMTGIMQLTCDANARIGYGCSLCTSNSRLRGSPLIGIDCAMNIISHWVKRGKLIGSHPYFETLRRNKHYNRKIRPTVQMYAPKSCGNNYKPNRYDWPLKAHKIASWRLTDR